MINMEDKKEIRRVGRTTFGFTFIIVGIAIILQLFIKQDVFRYVMLMWPVVLILFGIEVLYYSNKKDISIKYDVVGILLTFVIIICGTIFSAINLGITKLSESEFILNRPTTYNYTRRFYVEEIDLKVINLADEKLNIVVKEDKSLDNTRVNLEVKSKEEKAKNLRDLFNEHSIYDFVEFDNYEDNKIQIFDYPDWVDNMEITIYIPDKEKLEFTGNINVKD